MVQADFHLKEWYLSRKKFRVSEDYLLNSIMDYDYALPMFHHSLSVIVNSNRDSNVEIVEDLNLWSCGGEGETCMIDEGA